MTQKIEEKDKIKLITPLFFQAYSLHLTNQSDFSYKSRMQSVSRKQHISLFLLVQFLIIHGWSQCVPPNQLDPFQCNNCNEIRIFYCEHEPNPQPLSSFLQQNSSYQAGATFTWYSDNNGAPNRVLPAEPTVDVSYARSEYYWVSQEIGGCQSPAIRLLLRVRGTPQLQVNDSIDFCFPFQMDVAGQVIDRRYIANSYQYFDVNPTIGATPFQTLTASGGLLAPPNQSIWAAPPTPKSYWVIGINEGGFGPGCADTTSFTIVPHPIPQITPAQDIFACEGESVTFPPIQSSVPPSLIFWTNNNLSIGLGTYGFGNLPTFQVPLGISSPDTAQFIFYVLSGPCAARDTIEVIMQPKPVITSGLTDTVCSRENAFIPLSVSNQVPGMISYQWNAPGLETGLQGNAGGGTSTSIQDAFINENSNRLTAQYEVIAISEIGCESHPETIIVTVKPEPVISSSLGKNICSSQPAQLSFSTQNQLTAVSYSWSGGSLPAGLTGLNGSPSSSSGSQLNDAFLNQQNSSLSVGYQLHAEADGCSAIPQNLSLTIYPVQLAGPLQLLNCEDAAGSGQAVFDLNEINSQISGNPVNAFFLDSELTHAVASPQSFVSSGQTIYAVRYGTAPCPESWAVSLQIQALPSSPLPITAEACQGVEFTIQPTQGNSFSFYTADPASGAGQLLAAQISSYDTLLIIPNTTIEVWMTSFDGLCESQASLAEIAVQPIPYLFYINSNSPLCEGDDLEITPTTSGAQVFRWTSSDPAFSTNDSVAEIEQISLAQSGMYYLNILSNKGCEYQDSIEVQVVPTPYPGQDSVVSFCDGEPGFNLFDALGPGASSNGFWTGPSLVTTGYIGSFDPDSMNFGTYTFNLTGHNCQVAQFARVTLDYYAIPSPTLTANSPLFEEDELTLQADGGTSYFWTGPNGYAALGDQAIRPSITLADSGFYKVEVTNDGGCTGVDSVFVQVNEIPKIKFELAAWLEGPYDANTGLMWDSVRTLGAIPLAEPFTAMNFNFVGGGGETINPSVLQTTGPNAIVDWIFVDLRDANDSMVTVASRACLLQRDGDIVDLDGESNPEFRFLPDGFYYVVLDHRNHLSVMTEMPVYFDKSGNTSIDFRDASLPTFGFNPSKIVGNSSFLFSGDANGDDQVQVVDLVNFWVKNVGASGYLNADWNMDGQVQNIDFINYWIPNAGRGSQVPGKAL